MFHIFGSRYLSALKPKLTVFTDPKSQFVSEGYIEYFSVEKLHALSKLLDSIFFYSALLLIFLYLLLELLQNYVFLELYQMLIHCHSKSS